MAAVEECALGLAVVFGLLAPCVEELGDGAGASGAFPFASLAEAGDVLDAATEFLEDFVA